MKKSKKKILDIQDLDIPNVCFSYSSELPKDDYRQKHFAKQRIKRGFDSTEMWCLYSAIVKFILPRLKAFKEESGGYPGGFNKRKEWDEILDKMIEAFELINEKDHYSDEETNNKIDEGLDLFRKWFYNLWY
jgi:hypothetical protein